MYHSVQYESSLSPYGCASQYCMLALDAGPERDGTRAYGSLESARACLAIEGAARVTQTANRSVDDAPRSGRCDCELPTACTFVEWRLFI